MGILTVALLLVKVKQVYANSAPAAVNVGQVDASLVPAVVKVGQVGLSLSPVLYSIFLETEINFGGEGGIYAEQIRNRDFEALGRGNFNFSPDPSPSFSFKSSSTAVTPGLDPGEPAANFSDFRPWAPVGAVSLTLVNTTAPFSTNPTVLELHASSAGAGVSNPGYWGIGCGAEVGHALSLYAKSALPLTLTARLRRVNVGSVVSSVDITIPGGGNWSRYTAALLPLGREESAISSCEFELVLGSAGNVTLDSVSLMPADAVAGVLRRDVVEKLRALRPGFVRTPGGSYILGRGPRTQYNWANTVGPAAARPGHYNAAWGYWVTDGLGFFELLMLAEALDSELLMAVQDGQHSGPGGQYPPDEDYGKYIQGAVDMLEFATGDISTRWGRVRATMGHEAPFPLRRVEIGNEEVDHPTGSYARHFGLLAAAMRRTNPELEVISSGRWGNPRYYRRFDHSPCLTGQDCWAWDDHLYGTADSMAMLATFYDNYNATPRGGPMPPAFVGEWGAANGPVRTLRAAVGEALFLLGLERNGDVVRAASFAPLLKNTNGNASLPCCGNNHNLLNFNATALFAIPSFYGQQLFRETLGSHTLVTTTSGGHANEDSSGSESHTSTTSTNSSHLPSSSPTLWGAQASTGGNASTVKLVNYQGSELPMTVVFDAAALACGDSVSEANPPLRVVSATVLGGGDPLAENTLDAPTTVVPRDFSAAVAVAANGSALELTLPEWSVAVVTVACREVQGPVVQPSAAAPRGGDGLQPVYVNGDLNYSCFAIPALLGIPNGTLLAFAEGRGLRDKSGHRECHDLGDVMIVLKRSDDAGRSWSELRVVRDEYWQGAKAIGNAAPVFDATTQVVHSTNGCHNYMTQYD